MARTSGSRRSGSATGRTPTSSSPRCPASAGATRRPPSASTSARRRPATPGRLIAAARDGEAAAGGAAQLRGWAAVAQRPVRAGGGALRGAARRAGRRAGHRPDHHGPAGLGAARDGRRRFPGRPEVGPGRGAGGHAEIRHLQRRRVGAGDLQGPADPGRAAAPGARGHAARDARGRGRGRLGLHPARVRPRGAGDPPGDRGAARRRAGRGQRGRHRPAAVGRGVHQPGRLHPGRGVGADRVHGGAPRRAAEQAAVPRRLRPVGQADADELGGDVRARPGHRQPRRRLVEAAGHRRSHRA